MQCPQPHDQPRHAGLRPGQIKREHQEKIEPSSYSCTNALMTSIAMRNRKDFSSVLKDDKAV
jgi:hypothetical protein